MSPQSPEIKRYLNTHCMGFVYLNYEIYTYITFLKYVILVTGIVKQFRCSFESLKKKQITVSCRGLSGFISYRSESFIFSVLLSIRFKQKACAESIERPPDGIVTGCTLFVFIIYGYIFMPLVEISGYAIRFKSYKTYYTLYVIYVMEDEILLV